MVIIGKIKAIHDIYCIFVDKEDELIFMPKLRTQLIARNIVMQYIQVLYTMFVSFYTSRALLRALLIVEYMKGLRGTSQDFLMNALK